MKNLLVKHTRSEMNGILLPANDYGWWAGSWLSKNPKIVQAEGDEDKYGNQKLPGGGGGNGGGFFFFFPFFQSDVYEPMRKAGGNRPSSS